VWRCVVKEAARAARQANTKAAPAVR
jgi:hypothetical protein